MGKAVPSKLAENRLGDVDGCARCDGTHRNLIFRPFCQPVHVDAPITLTHWSTCPVTLEPILQTIETGRVWGAIRQRLPLLRHAMRQAVEAGSYESESICFDGLARSLAAAVAGEPYAELLAATGEPHVDHALHNWENEGGAVHD